MAPPTSSQTRTTEDAVMNDANVNVSETVPKNDRLTHLPRELLSEIAKQLHPLDLIYLARVNKLLCGIFMDSSAAEIWRATLTSVGLPPCPDTDVHEPEYAALMFLKECTECSEPAGRHMDPIILVRLCSSCRKYLAVKAETVPPALQPLLSRSQFLVPPKGAKRPYWYWRDSYEEVNEVHTRFRDSGDVPALMAYVEQRKKIVQEWQKQTKPLVEWVEKQEKERNIKLSGLKVARRIEVETRLRKLGWEEADIRDCFYFSGDGKAMIYQPKILDDADWNVMLPYLLKGLETARGHRLRMEADGRSIAHEEIIDTWLTSLDGLGHLNLTLHQRESTGNPASGPIDILCAHRRQQGTEKQGITLRIPSLPLNRYVLKWLPVEELINQDKPTEEFQPEFEGKHDPLKEQLTGWRSTLEAALVRALPETFKPAETQSSQFNLEATHTKDATKSSDSLSVDLRVLLRADVVFKYDHKSVYYPSSFNSWMIDARTPTFDLASSTVAKAILKELQHVDASYLEMQALGSTFLCGRCTSDPKYFTWEGIVNHFVYEQERWKTASHWNNQYREEGEGITLVFTHDINDSDKPLINLVAEPDQVISPKTPQTECKVCLSIGQHYRTGLAHITKHIQATHLIENPVQGEHCT